MTVLNRVLIANRGEIAIRIAKAAASVGMDSVAVYAPVDNLSLHTRTATEACALPQDGIAAYLDGAAIIEIARQSNCDCVHPGYGFLAENADFAAACAAEGIAFVGPSVAALRLFGDKVAARALAQANGIPVVPGSEGALSTADQAHAAADAIGYPVMLKAAAGGGGRGMRAVASADELAEAFERCRSEAGSKCAGRFLRQPRSGLHGYRFEFIRRKPEQEVARVPGPGDTDPSPPARPSPWQPGATTIRPVLIVPPALPDASVPLAPSAPPPPPAVDGKGG